jgi:CheY-like chemotaxis protein
VEAYGLSQFDVILMDVQMPGMNGIDATKAIRELEAAQGWPQTPILALSANVMTHQIAEYQVAGMDGWIAKPIEAMKLFEGLEAALELGEQAQIEAGGHGPWDGSSTSDFRNRAGQASSD